MFKTARFKLHNPSRHKATVLRYAMERYHLTLKRVIEVSLADPALLEKISLPDKKGRLRVNGFATQKFLYTIAPKGGPISPLRDYLVGDAAAMVLSHFKKLEKGANLSNPPTVGLLKALTPEEKTARTEDFAASIRFPIKPQQEEKIGKATAAGQTRVARRLESIYRSWAGTRAAGELLRSLDVPLPRPIEFTRPEFGRGYLLARNKDKYYLLVRLFSEGHRYRAKVKLNPGFVDIRKGEVLDGKAYPGLIFPLEFARDYHQQEYLCNGRPQSAKIILKRNEAGQEEFFVHVAFKFTATPVQTCTFLGIDRGAAMIGAGSLVDSRGLLLPHRFDLHGEAFNQAMARERSWIADQQKKGIQKSRRFRIRGRRSDIVIGEYGNRLIAAALEHKSQIVLEKIQAVAMNRFLLQSQFRKLHSVLSYKAARVGLPEPLEVPAQRTSQTCGQCGHWAPENRPKKDAQGQALQDVFLCTGCGYRANADHNASHVIALRGLHQSDKGGKFRKFAEFQSWLQGLTRPDGGIGSPIAGL